VAAVETSGRGVFFLLFDPFLGGRGVGWVPGVGGGGGGGGGFARGGGAGLGGGVWVRGGGGCWAHAEMTRFVGVDKVLPQWIRCQFTVYR